MLVNLNHKPSSGERTVVQMLSKEAFKKVISEFPWLWAVWLLPGHDNTHVQAASHNIRVCRMDSMEKLFFGKSFSKDRFFYAYSEDSDEASANVRWVSGIALYDDPRRGWPLAQWLLQPEFGGVTAFAVLRLPEKPGSRWETIVIKPNKDQTIRETLSIWANQPAMTGTPRGENVE